MATATASPEGTHGDGFAFYHRVERFEQPTVRLASRSRASDAGRPNYVARRLVACMVTLLTIATLAVAISGVLASFGGDPASASEVSSANTVATPRSHVARSGDTMWSLATTYRGDIDHGHYLDALIRSNGGVSIVVGQAVQLP